MANKSTPSPSVPRAVYDGRDRMGHVETRGSDHVAFDRQGRIIGTFDTAGEAIAAITKLVTGVAR